MAVGTALVLISKEELASGEYEDFYMLSDKAEPFYVWFIRKDYVYKNSIGSSEYTLGTSGSHQRPTTHTFKLPESVMFRSVYRKINIF